MAEGKTIIIIGGSFAGVKVAWDLRHKLGKEHKIFLVSDKAKTIFRASFPHVIFEDLPLEKLTLDLQKNFEGTGITFIQAALLKVDQDDEKIVTEAGEYKFDYLILATGARHAYELLPGSYEFAKTICDPAKILETKEAIKKFREGEFFAGVGAGYTPCDGPPMEVIMDLHHRLRELGIRNKARLHYFTDKEQLLPPGGPKVWKYLEEFFKKREIIVHLGVELQKLDESKLYFKDGKEMNYDLCVLVPPYRGIKALEDSGLVNERGLIPVENTMRASKSKNYNVYAVGDCIGNPGPKQAHLALMQAAVAAEHIAWRINKSGNVRAYLPEFKCVMDIGGGNGLYLYSRWLSDGDVVEIKEGHDPYLSKLKFEQLFFEKKGDIGELHHEMMK